MRANLMEKKNENSTSKPDGSQNIVKNHNYNLGSTGHFRPKKVYSAAYTILHF
jgi:hypothetical protein